MSEKNNNISNLRNKNHSQSSPTEVEDFLKQSDVSSKSEVDAFLNKVKIVNFDKLGSELAETLALIKRSGIDL